MRVVVISGLSGAGKGVALRALEDLDFHCVDNLPLELLPDLAGRLSVSAPAGVDRLALVVDARNLSPDFGRFSAILQAVTDGGASTEVLYLEAQTDVLLKRFSETRRKHPLTAGGVSLEEAIEREAVLLEPIRAVADLCLDTTRTHQHQLRDLVVQRVGGRAPGGLSLQFESFGYKHGLPVDVDLVFDARCLPNPYWEPELRALDGRAEEVARFLAAHPAVEEMCAQIGDYLDRWIPEFVADNRAYLTVAVGCTGGQHRSVYLAERLAERFRGAPGHVIVRHRDLP